MTQSDDAMTMLVREFATTLRQVREEETARLRLTLYELELLRDGLAALNADMRAGRL
jgi:hypothetical protein